MGKPAKGGETDNGGFERQPLLNGLELLTFSQTTFIAASRSPRMTIAVAKSDCDHRRTCWLSVFTFHGGTFASTARSRSRHSRRRRRNGDLAGEQNW